MASQYVHRSRGPDYDYEPDNNDNQGRNSPPTVGGLVRVRSAANVLPPDSEEHVQAQTEDVFLNYVYQSYRNDTMQENAENTPVVPELVNFTAAPITPAAEIGRQLARLGDDINDRYADMFDGMIAQLNLDDASDQDVYDTFASIGRRVFATGTSWGRILMLLGFGYRIAMSVLRRQAANFGAFLTRIVGFICKFVVSERIAKWIAEHGGWRAALTIIPSTTSNAFWFVSGLATLSVLAVFALRRWG